MESAELLILRTDETVFLKENESIRNNIKGIIGRLIS